MSIFFKKVGNPFFTTNLFIDSKYSIFSKAVSLCLSSIFGVGISKFRISKPKKREFVDTVPFGCFRRSLFDEIGLFNEKEPRNEDLEFNQRILRNISNLG